MPGKETVTALGDILVQYEPHVRGSPTTPLATCLPVLCYVPYGVTAQIFGHRTPQSNPMIQISRSRSMIPAIGGDSRGGELQRCM